MPPATAGPAIAAITGFDRSRRVGPMGPRGGVPSWGGKSRAASGRGLPSRLAANFRSNPAQKAPPAPQSTATDWPGSRSKASNASTRASALAGSMALRASVRDRTMVVTGPSRSTFMIIRDLAWRAAQTHANDRHARGHDRDHDRTPSHRRPLQDRTALR